MTTHGKNPSTKAPRRKRAATDPLAQRIMDAAQADVAEVIELKLVNKKASTPRGRKASTPPPTPAPAPRVKASRPNADRRNEATHVDGAAAVAHGKCPKCGARKGVKCTSQRGEPTNFVHAPRMAAWDAS
jgi:hypothetical protein